MAKRGRPKREATEVKRYCRNKTWWLDWGRGQRRVRLSLETEDAIVAEDMQLQIQRFLLKPDDNPIPTWALANPKVQKWANTMNSPEVGDKPQYTKLHHAANFENLPIIQRYKERLLSQHSNTTARSKYGNIMDMVDYLGIAPVEITSREADRYLVSVTTDDKRVRRSGRKYARSVRTRNTIMKDCRLFYKWAIETQGYHANPFAHCKELPVQDTDDIIYCTKEERQILLNAVKGYPDELAYWIALYAGLRRGEIYQLDWRNIDLERSFIHIINMRVKTGKRRSIPIPTPLKDVLKANCPKKKQGYVIG